MNSFLLALVFRSPNFLIEIAFCVAVVGISPLDGVGNNVV